MAIKGVFAALLVGAKAVFSFILSASARLAVSLVNPWTLLIAAITAAMALAERYYKQQQEAQNKRSKQLEDERQRIVGQSFRDAGQAVPADLSKSLDISKARAVSPSGGSVAKSQVDLAKEISEYKTALQTFRQRIEDAQVLLNRGTIDKKQFEDFAKRELANFKKSDPVTQQRNSLRDQLMTPLEVFERSVQKASKLFAGDPEMFQRARDAALETFKANDKATQVAKQLQTPFEQFKSSVSDARKLFAGDTKNLSRAIKAAKAVFDASNPVEQLRLSLRTPLEIFRDRMEEVRRIVAQSPIAQQEGLLKRATEQEIKRFNESDPDRVKAKGIRESLLSEGENIAKQLVEAFELVKKGLLNRDELKALKDNLLEGEIGERPDVEISRSLATTNAGVASRLSSFAPAFDKDQQLIEFEKKKEKLQGEIRDGINKLVRKREVLT